MKLAVIGASARAASCAAVAAGHQVVAADLFADLDLLARCEATKIDDWPAGCAVWLANQQVDAWLYTGGFENHVDLVGRMRQIRPLAGNHGETLRRCRSVDWLAAFCKASDLRMPSVAWHPPATTDGWLVKSSRSAGGLGVRDHLQDEPTASDSYWQRRIQGRSLSAAYVAARGSAVLLGVTEQLIGRAWTHARCYQYAGSVGPLEIAPAVREQLSMVGAKLAAATGLVGLFGVDFVLDSAGDAYLVDVNPRYTASMEIVERCCGRSLLAMHLAACFEGRLPREAESSSPPICGKAYLFAPRDVNVQCRLPADCADVPAPGTRITAGSPICTVFADAGEYQSVEPLLQAKIREIKKHLGIDGEPQIGSKGKQGMQPCESES